MFFGTKDSYLDTPIAYRVRNTGFLHLVLVGLMAGRQAGRLTDKIQLYYEILKILYGSNCSDFYFVYSSAMLLIVL